jgi:hypothetical protein
MNFLLMAWVNGTIAGSGDPHTPGESQFPNPALVSQFENFNPELQHPDPALQPPGEPDETLGEDDENQIEIHFAPEELTLDYSLDKDNFGQRNQFLEAQATFHLVNTNEGENDNFLHWRMGLNNFGQEGHSPLTNIPLEIGWSRQLEPIKLEIQGRLDYFDRLDMVPGLRARVEYPVFARVNGQGELQSLLVMSGEVDHGPYKFNAGTLENDVRYWRVSPSIYWQFAPNTSLFTLGQGGTFNDGNQEFQSFSRLEHQFDQLEGTIGTFSLAANLFTWAFRQDLENTSGYFSPPDFLVYSLEVGWSGDLHDRVNCRISASQGRQRSVGSFANAGTLQSRCGFRFSDRTTLDLGYGVSNVINGQGETAFINQSISGNLQINF